MGIVVDMKNPSKAFMEGYPNSNCEQFQKHYDELSKKEREIFKKDMQKLFANIYDSVKEKLKLVSISELNKSITKFKKAGGEITTDKDGHYMFNGHYTTKTEPLLTVGIYEDTINRLTDKIEALNLELLEMRRKGKNFGFIYKMFTSKKEKEIRAKIADYQKQQEGIQLEVESEKAEYEKQMEAFNMAKDVLDKIEELTIEINALTKSKMLLDYMNNKKGDLSAAQFVKEYNEPTINLSQKGASMDIVSHIVNNNKFYRSVLDVNTMREMNSVCAYAVNLDLDKKPAYTEKTNMESFQQGM